jgi:hypothetical protein
MASPLNAALCALVATALWTVLGYALSRRLLPRALATGAAPVIGWATHSAVMLPLFTLIGFTQTAVIAVAAVCVLGSALAPGIAEQGGGETAPSIPLWAFAAAAVLALAPAVAILPKMSGDLIYLADPIFDHAKIALIDAMARQGLPPVDPVFGAVLGQGQFFYYYLWHFSAAELALALHTSGWEADVGLTWFTAFASLSLLMGTAVWLSKKSVAAIFVVLLAAATSLRVTLAWLLGRNGLEPFMAEPTGFAGWLFQAAWAPQHLMAATCVLASMLLIASYAQQRSVLLMLAIALIVVAGFESSAFIGGITFAPAALATALFVIARIEPPQRFRFVVGMAAAVVLAELVAAPFLHNQLYAVAARGNAKPIEVRHFEVLGAMFPQGLRRALDWPAYWLVLLPIEFPATFLSGAIALFVLLRSGTARQEKLLAIALACLGGAGLLVSWLLVSTVGDNNDLGLRAILPTASVLIALSAAGIVLTPRRATIGIIAIVGLVLSLPDTVGMIRSNIDGSSRPDGAVFAQSPELWTAVRRYAPITARVANNPLYLQDLTPWPANLSWALLANRNSCFAGRELALAFAPLPDDMREAINAQIIRVFAGEGTAQDVGDLAKKYNCDVIVVTPQDKAWGNDPFASNADFRLAENRDGKWRIYTVVKSGANAR